MIYNDNNSTVFREEFETKLLLGEKLSTTLNILNL